MKKTYIYVATAIFCWSTVATVTKLLLGELSSIQVLWASSFFAGLFLLIVNIATGNIHNLKNYTFKDYLTAILICLPGTFLYYMFYYAGADILPASQAFIINYMWPIMCVIFACIILKEKMTLRKGVAMFVSFVGVCIVAGGELSGFSSKQIVGVVFCLLGAMSYGVFTSLNQKFKYEKRISMMLSYFVTFILTTVINAVKGDLFTMSIGQVVGFAWNGMFTMAVANVVWVLALSGENTAKISNFAYITPFLSLVWTSLILKESIHLTSIVGLIIIVSGILIQLNKSTSAKINRGEK